MSKHKVPEGLLEEMRLIDKGTHNVSNDMGVLRAAGEWQGRAQSYAREFLKIYDSQENSKPKTVVEEIFERLRNHQGAEGSLHEQIYVDRLCMALAEAVEGLRMIHCGDQKGSVGKHDVFLSALSILKGEKTRDIPEA